MKKFFASIGTFVRAMPHFLLFELLFKLLLIAFGAPVLAISLKLTMKAAGISYIYDESLLTYLHSPVTVFFLIILLFLFGFFSFVELTALAACFSCYGRGETITVGGMMRTGFKGFAKAFRGSGIAKFFGFTMFMPFTEFTLSSGVFMVPLLPLLRWVFKRIGGYMAVIVYIIIQTLMILIIVGRSYSLHYLVLTDRDFPECVRASREKIGRKRISMAVRFLLWTLFIFAAIAILTFGISFIIIYGVKGFSKPESSFRTALYVLKYAMNVFTAISAFFSAPAIMCWLTGEFFGDLDENETVTVPDKERPKMGKKKKAVLITTLAAAALLLDFGYIRTIYKGNFRFAAGFLTRAQISAHRGFSHVAPENTSYAFEAAMESGADYIELDVRLTKDGQLVVFHDSTLERTTNGSGKLSDYTYNELQKLSAGTDFGEKGEFDDAKIMLLSEVLELVDRKKLLNIEIKESAGAVQAAEKTVELLEEYNLEGSCYVTSFSYTILKRVKELNPRIKTALIANMAASTSYSMLEYIDAVSMNYLFVNQSVVHEAHRNGKLIFVWTVDRRADIEQMVALGVDNIITNRPDIAVEVVYSNGIGDTFIRILESIFQ